MEDLNLVNSFPRPVLPRGFRTLLYSLSKEVLRHQPDDLYTFCAAQFERMLAERGDSWLPYRDRHSRRKPPLDDDGLNAAPQQLLQDALHRWQQPQLPGRQPPVNCSDSALRLMSESTQQLARWEEPLVQLQRDVCTVSERVEVGELRDRAFSATDVSLEDIGPLGLRQHSTPHSTPHVSAEPDGDAYQFDEVMSGRESCCDLSCFRHSDIDLHFEHQFPAAGRAYSPLSVGERVEAVSQPTSPPIAVASERGCTLAGSDLELAVDVRGQQGAESGRAGSPPELLPRAHSPLELGGDEFSQAAGRAGSVPELRSPAHSQLDLAERGPVDSSTATAPRAASPPSVSNSTTAI